MLIPGDIKTLLHDTRNDLAAIRKLLEQLVEIENQREADR